MILNPYRILVCTLVLLVLFAGGIAPAAGSVAKTNTLYYPASGQAYIIQLSSSVAPVLPGNYDDLLRFHYYGICWARQIDEGLQFARQMGYAYVFHKSGMEKSPLAADFYFYLETPEYMAYNYLKVDRTVSENKQYTPAQINTYQQYFALKDTTSPFPKNLVPGWPSKDGGFCVEPDYQQQRVIDYFSEKVMAIAAKVEKKEKRFLFGGLAWDVPEVGGLFYANGKPKPLSYWTKTDSTALFAGTTHQYQTYNEGKVAYFNTVKQAAMTQFPGRKLGFIFEPYPIYHWIADLAKLDVATQTKLFAQALIAQESGNTPWSTGTEFVDDPRIFKSGLLAKTQMGSDTPDNHDLYNNLTFASKAAINGAWFNWFGRISGSGDKVPMREISEVPNWLQLIRVVANWDNLNGIPLSSRALSGTTYTSTNSRMDENIIYSRQPKTQKLFVVFLNKAGEITMNPGEKIVSVKRVDSLFRETVNAVGDLTTSGNKIKLSSRQ
ncbi:MAG: hypothetical protein WCO56_15970 [Verrucomicrobiota bacterium]